jgi:hypothetical protein
VLGGWEKSLDLWEVLACVWGVYSVRMRGVCGVCVCRLCGVCIASSMCVTGVCMSCGGGDGGYSVCGVCGVLVCCMCREGCYGVSAWGCGVCAVYA